MGRPWTRARTEASSTEVQASTTFGLNKKWGTAQDVRDYTHIAVWFDPTTIGSNSEVEIVLAWSDDGSTIGFADDNNYQMSDFNMDNFTDGSFNPKPYTAVLTVVGGELADNQKVHLVLPVKAGYCRVGVSGDVATGAYSVRTQRLVL